MTPVLWDRLDAMIDSAPGLGDLRAHGLHLLAARRWRELGRHVPADLVGEELRAAFVTHTAPALLERVRAACDGPVLVMKGPVVASCYPDPTLRPFQDIDLLVGDPREAQQALLADGFQPSGNPRHYVSVQHHVRPLRSPNFPVDVELHSRPKWIEGLSCPPLDDLLAGAEPAGLGIDGILTFPAPKHALVLAVHLWEHDPLTRLLRLLDIAVMLEHCDERDLDSLARTWRMERLWKTTLAVIDAVFFGAKTPWPLRHWGRGLTAVRESTVFEVHLGRCIAPFWILPPGKAARAFGGSLEGFARRQPGESWRGKLERTVRQLRQPSMRRSEHVRSIDME